MSDKRWPDMSDAEKAQAVAEWKQRYGITYEKTAAGITFIIDKTKWGHGPWQHEPDRIEWRHLGLPCLIARNSGGGNLCGYVGVPPGHPWHGKDYSDLDNVDVHGGLTYSRGCAEVGAVCHVPAPGEPDGIWWLGFDCAHSGDSRPGWADHFKFQEEYSVYRDVEYVRREVERLAEQAAHPQTLEGTPTP
jgi:hypothetical protein